MTSKLKLARPELLRHAMLIKGEWVTKAATFPVLDPASLKELGPVPAGTTEDVNTAIVAAKGAFNTFKKTTGRYRSDVLRSWAKAIRENVDDLGRIVSYENGKPLLEAKGEVMACAQNFEWFSEVAPHYTGDTILSQNPNVRLQTWKQPIGVCSIITPWNFPASMIARKAGAALAAGCTMVIKPAAETPFSALAMAYLAEEAGVPVGVINVVTGSHEGTPAIGKELCQHPDVAKVTFTGSTRVGKILMEQAAVGMKKVSFELGGNAPFIVFDDADIEKAVAGALASKFRGSGQTCICANRFYVQEGIHDAFVARFAEEVKKLKVGHGLEEGITQGPVISNVSFDKVQKLTNDAIAKGAVVHTGGHPLPNLGPHFFEPTLLSGGTKDMEIFHEEVFGPLAVVAKFKTEDEVLELANNTRVGLAGYFFTKDLGRLYRVAEALEVGMIGVNTGLITETALPFGGVKESGFGREGSKYGLDDYTIVKTVAVSI